MKGLGGMKGILTSFILLTGIASCSRSDAVWERASVSGPRMKVEFAMVFDAAHERIVAFGGRDKNFDGVDETWVYDCKTHTWANAHPASSPPYRSSLAMTYDPVRKKVLMFGGDNFERAFNDLWEYDSGLNTWTELSPSNPPDARQMHGMTYDANRNVVLMFGGRRTGGGAQFKDTWEYRSATNSWRSLDPVHSPPAQDHTKIAYDPRSKRPILFTGAIGHNTASVGTWAYENGDWKKLDIGVSPTGGHASFVYDGKIGKLILIGHAEESDMTDTWMFDGVGEEWTRLSASGRPPLREHFGLTYDELHDTFILVGGFPNSDNWQMKLRPS